MKVLVLGSDGQIGEPLVEYLNKLHYNVIEFDVYSNQITDLRIPNILDGILPLQLNHHREVFIYILNIMKK